jgi:DNA-binding transcriptional regulator YdaS (Cro superfamily)
MTAPELAKLMSDLSAWCAQGYGRQQQIADALGTSRSLVNDWIKGRRSPSAERYFALKAFLKKQRRAKA